MTTKLAYLDSLRGLAAIIVVVAHSVGAFYPHAIFGEPYPASTTAELWLRVPPLSLAIAGHAAVCLFFILSGYVLSLSFLTRPSRPGQLFEAMLKRPIRLGGLVVVTVVVGYALMVCGAFITQESHGAQAAPWLAGFWQTTPSLRVFLLDLASEPFASGTRYNPPLWTIHKELVGSYLVFGYLAVCQRLSARGRWIFLSVLGLLTFRSLYVGFVIGLAFAQAQSQASSPRRTVHGLNWALLLVGLALASQLHYLRPELSPRSELSLTAKLAADFGTGGSAMAGALLIFAAVWLDERFQKALENAGLQFFGRISFAMYALHFLVLGSLTWHAYRMIESPLGHHFAAAIATTGSYALLIVLSHVATRWVDRPSTQFANSFAKAIAQKTIAWRGARRRAEHPEQLTDAQTALAASSLRNPNPLRSKAG